MAQQTTGDFDIVPASTPGETLAAILNRNNAANITMHSGATAPTYKLNGMLWLDTTSATEHICKYYNSDNTTWVELFRVTIATGAILFTSAGIATSGSHLTNKTYVDAADILKLNLTGGTVTGQIKGITPVANEDLVRKDYADGLFDIDTLQVAGLLLTGYGAFDGTATDTNSPAADYNINTVQRVSAGVYDVLFSTNMDILDYSVVISLDGGVLANNFLLSSNYLNKATTGFRIETGYFSTSNVFFDVDDISFHVFGGLT